MIRHRFAKRAILSMVMVMAMAAACGYAKGQRPSDQEDRAALAKTGDAIRAAFARSDLEAILSYHHPDVVKALRPAELVVGRDALKANLEQTFRSNTLAFRENRLEDLRVLGDSAVEISSFIIHGEPKNGGAPFDAKGRAMVVYVRYKPSPTGWASIREVIQSTP